MHLTLKKASLLFAVLLPAGASHALSPPNPNADIPWEASNTDAGSVESIESAFTQARRAEEKQLKLSPNSLGDLQLPSQSEWDATPAAEKALILTNAERNARHLVDYPKHGTVQGLPLEAVEPRLNELAQAYADYMVQHDFWDHQVPTQIKDSPFAGSDSFSRINEHTEIGGDCSQFLPYAENLYVTATTVANAPTPNTLIEAAVYNWLYDDSGSAWGHRVAMFLQDQTLDGHPGFNNDRGPASSEGLMGLGFSGRGDGSYNVFNDSAFPSQWNVVWLVMDPAPLEKCGFIEP